MPNKDVSLFIHEEDHIMIGRYAAENGNAVAVK